jgi:hypothetical protein
MLKALRTLFFGAGRMPEPARSELLAENVLALEEGLWITVTWLNFRAPGRYSNWKRQAHVGALALTSRRLVGYTRRTKIMDVPFDHPTLREVRLRLDPPGALCFACDAAKLRPEQSGTIEVRFFTPRAAEILALLQKYLPG